MRGRVYADGAGTTRARATWAGSASPSDNVFGDDGGIHQIATMAGDPSAGYIAALTIGV